ncbi:MAG: ArsR/SmtB family transcription factor [Candidatus Dormibacterales bacterium]
MVGANATIGAKLFHGFSDPTRLAILRHLLTGEMRVTDLVRELGGSQANISGHVACLKGCGLVLDRPEGRQVFYRIAGPEVIDLLRAAERLLALHGQTIELCPGYQEQADG